MAFLDEMGLTFDQLLTRPVLVDIVVSYHICELPDAKSNFF